MLARLITAPFRFVRTYREELLIVALGLAYQAGTNGTLARAAHMGHGDHQQVTIRIAEAPRGMVVVRHDVAPVMAVASVETMSTTTVERRAARRAAQARDAQVREAQVRVREAQARAREARVRAQSVREQLLREARRAREAALAAHPAAAVAAEQVALGQIEDLMPELEAQVRVVAVDEARIRAAIARAMAAEQATRRPVQGT